MVGQYRARKQADPSANRRLLTRAALSVKVQRRLNYFATITKRIIDDGVRVVEYHRGARRRAVRSSLRQRRFMESSEMRRRY